MPRSSSRLSAFVNNIIGESRACNFGRSIFEIPESNMFESEERRKLLDAQKSLHLHLKPEILKLCGILQLSVRILIILLTTFTSFSSFFCTFMLLF